MGGSAISHLHEQVQRLRAHAPQLALEAREVRVRVEHQAIERLLGRHVQQRHQQPPRALLGRVAAEDRLKVKPLERDERHEPRGRRARRARQALAQRRQPRLVLVRKEPAVGAHAVHDWAQVRKLAREAPRLLLAARVPR